MSDAKKNIKAKLKARIEAYEATIKGAKNNGRGFRKPGSLSGRK